MLHRLGHDAMDLGGGGFGLENRMIDLAGKFGWSHGGREYRSEGDVPNPLLVLQLNKTELKCTAFA